MSGSPITPTLPLSPAEMQVLVSRAGLTLNPGQMADLVLAWRQMVGLLGLIPRDRPLADDQAFVFRLPPARQSPATMVAARARKSAPPAGGKAAAPGRQEGGGHRRQKRRRPRWQEGSRPAQARARQEQPRRRRASKRRPLPPASGRSARECRPIRGR